MVASQFRRAEWRPAATVVVTVTPGKIREDPERNWICNAFREFILIPNRCNCSTQPLVSEQKMIDYPIIVMGECII